MQPLRELSKVMRECWYQIATARLSPLRIKKTLLELESVVSSSAEVSSSGADEKPDKMEMSV